LILNLPSIETSCALRRDLRNALPTQKRRQESCPKSHPVHAPGLRSADGTAAMPTTGGANERNDERNFDSRNARSITRVRNLGLPQTTTVGRKKPVVTRRSPVGSMEVVSALSACGIIKLGRIRKADLIVKVRQDGSNLA
jgi:hypothetical protein